MPLDVNMCKLKIGNKLIDRNGLNCKDKYFKFVGVRLDVYLTWDFHIIIIIYFSYTQRSKVQLN